MAKILTQHNERPPAARAVTVGDLVLSYIESLRMAGREPRTIQLYEFLARKRLLPAIGHVRAADLRPADVEHFYATQLTAGRLDGREGPCRPPRCTGWSTCCTRPCAGPSGMACACAMRPMP